MHRVRDIAPQPPSAYQLARQDRQLQDKLMQQHVLQPASPASAQVSAERHDAAVRNMRLAHAAELAAMQTEARLSATIIVELTCTGWLRFCALIGFSDLFVQRDMCRLTPW